MKFNESDKITLVTGTSKGIGRAIAIGLASDGFKIGVNYCSPENKAIEISFGSIPTVLVNNARIVHDNQLISMSEEDFDSAISINLKGAFLYMREAARRIISKKYGEIINITSTVGFTGNPGVINYAVSKERLHYMTRTIHVDGGISM